ncbi:uncharacterized protein CCOS01_14174 [Colletotrichum costaricense]|uniref:Cyanovirin-N domain-containing protein n=1 Tax=Colletotrichum costaricense TaxID=1209916 RepID=A0AAI9YJJ5_9PEZI|nr:uncharacterized protein CCOS01_14174 [Colletotrichum costaricense]KAK1513232.1 hypothetical protein CCOS01_14174 [Colletotrichum costaricense]
MRTNGLLSAFAAALLAPLYATAAVLPEETSANISARQTMTLMGGMAATCNSFSMSNVYPTFLYANCRAIDGSWKTSYVSLDLCLANSCGRLVSASRGSYSNSCSARYCQLIGTRYQCTCRGCSNNDVFSIIELNDIVGNDNGELICHGLNIISPLLTFRYKDIGSFTPAGQEVGARVVFDSGHYVLRWHMQDGMAMALYKTSEGSECLLNMISSSEVVHGCGRR